MTDYPQIPLGGAFSRPMLKTVLFFGGGIALGWKFFADIPIWFLAIVIFSAGLSSIIKSKQLSINIVSGWILVFAVGFTYSALNQNGYYNSYLYVKANTSPEVIFSGTVVSQEKEELNRLIKLKWLINGGDTVSVRTKVWLRGRMIDSLSYGDIIVGRGILKPIPEKINSGGFDFGGYSRKVGAAASILCSNVFVTGSGGNRAISELIVPFREYTKRQSETYIGGYEAGIFDGLVLGMRGEFDSEFKDALRYSGLWHLAALSGMHLVIFAGIVGLLLGVFNVPIKFRGGIIIVLIWAFTFTAVARSPLIRASIVLTAALFSPYLRRYYDKWNLLAFSALVILIFNPAELFSAGYQLSFSAFSFILAGMESWNILFDAKIVKIIRFPFIRKIFTGLIISCFASAGTAPIIAYHFGGIGLASIPAGVVGIPLSGIIIGIAPLFYLFSWISPTAGVIFGNGLLGLLFIFEKLIIFSSQMGLYISTPNLSIFETLVITAVLLLMIFRRRWWLILGLVASAVLVWRGVFTDDEVRAAFLDVGQGNSAVVELPGGIDIVVDTGPGQSVEKVVLPYLRKQGISEIDYLIITHNDIDHNAGTDYLINNFKVDNLIISSSIGKLEFAGNIDTVRAGDYIDTGGGLLMFFNPMDTMTEDNEKSLAFKLIFKNSSIFFTGDIPLVTEKNIARYDDLLDADVLSVSHHGSKYSSSEGFLRLVTPDVSVISCGRNNKYNHPAPETLRRLEECGSSTERTDLDGSILIEFDRFGRRKIIK